MIPFLKYRIIVEFSFKISLFPDTGIIFIFAIQMSPAGGGAALSAEAEELLITN
jgi:hypothetical protein